MFHQFVAAYGNFPSVNLCNNTFSADFTNVADTAAVNFFSISTLETFADRMGRGALRKSRVFYQFLVFHLIMMDTVYLKNTLGQCSGFIEDHDFRLGKRFQIIGPLDQDACIAGSSDSRKET